jgi:apolipoprotein D and lipocalin family protein
MRLSGRVLSYLRAGWPGRAAIAVALVVGAAPAIGAQAPPAALERFETSTLVGDWYEVATTGTWWHRRCVADTRYAFDAADRAGLRASSVCSTPAGTARFRGQLRAGRDSDGRLSIRFTPPVFNWLAATWSDFWVLDSGADMGWLLVGDNRRERLLVLSRTVALDEAAFAQALASARLQGYDVDRLARVPHPMAATGLLPRR